MPDESCRKCGGVLLDYSVCAKCRMPIQYICRVCANKTLEQFHEGFCFDIIKLESHEKRLEETIVIKINQ